ncbi:MAG: 50S ribosomal protein L18 [bacterium]|nr:50S ribosomal protein L18 [bacterium]
MNPLAKKLRRQRRIRGKISGTADRPRFSVFRSNTHIFAQLIDDQKKETICALSDRMLEGTEKVGKTDQAKKLGMALAKIAREKKVKKVVFDKGRYAYHGRVKAVAEGAREGGLEL